MLTTSFFHTQLQKDEIIKDVSQDKATGTYKIPPKIIKLSAKVILKQEKDKK